MKKNVFLIVIFLTSLGSCDTNVKEEIESVNSDNFSTNKKLVNNFRESEIGSHLSKNFNFNYSHIVVNDFSKSKLLFIPVEEKKQMLELIHLMNIT